MMPRKLRVEYPGAVYHVLSRGDRREDIFLDDGEQWQPLRRGWCLGSEAFRAQLLEWMSGKLGEHHSGELRRETAQAKAERIVGEQMKRKGWKEPELRRRSKSDPGKLAMAARLRRETTLPIKWIAARLHLGTSKSANSNLHRWMQHEQLPNPMAPAHPMG